MLKEGNLFIRDIAKSVKQLKIPKFPGHHTHLAERWSAVAPMDATERVTLPSITFVAKRRPCLFKLAFGARQGTGFQVPDL